MTERSSGVFQAAYAYAHAHGPNTSGPSRSDESHVAAPNSIGGALDSVAHAGGRPKSTHAGPVCVHAAGQLGESTCSVRSTTAFY